VRDMAENEISLPQPRLSGARSLEEALSQRRSQRSFGRRPLTWEEIGQLAWAAQGITGDDARWRTAPSAGALHPLELFVVFADQSFHYHPTTHSLHPHPAVSLDELATAALNQKFIAQAPCVFAFAAQTERTTKVYKERSRDYICMDLGHAAQNLLLQATTMGMTGTPVAAFNDAAVKLALKLPPGLDPFYLIPLGYPQYS